jgi:hypothetical protein
MHAGKRNAAAIPQSIPTKINIGRLLERESITRAAVDVDINVRMILSFLHISKTFPPKIRPMIIVKAMAEKKSPGFATPHWIAYKEKKAATDDQVTYCRKLVIAGTTIFHSSKKVFLTGDSCSDVIVLCPLKFKEKRKAQTDSAMPVRRRTVKLYRFIRNMPKGAAMAIAKEGARRI